MIYLIKETQGLQDSLKSDSIPSLISPLDLYFSKLNGSAWFPGQPKSFNIHFQQKNVNHSDLQNIFSFCLCAIIRFALFKNLILTLLLIQRFDRSPLIGNSTAVT